MNPPEFSVILRTEGGPATYVLWWGPVDGDRDHETSQTILDTSKNSVYENRLRVRGREGGIYLCTITNNKNDFFSEAVSVVQELRYIEGL